MVALWIPVRLPGLNELMDARMITGRGSKHPKQWNKYSDMKRAWASRIKLLCYHRRFEFIARGHFTYLFVEPATNRDKSNVIGGGVKLIEDALVEAKILKNDNWSVIEDIRSYVIHRKGCAGVLVVAHEQKVFELQEMLEIWEIEHGREKTEKWQRTRDLRHAGGLQADRTASGGRPGAGGELHLESGVEPGHGSAASGELT